MVFVSSLIRGMDQMEEVALWVNHLNRPDVGVELIAFTHDEAYWNRLEAILEKLSCPVSFHGPYVGTEGTSQRGTQPWEHIMDSYRRVFELAAKYGIRHVVYHTTQLGWKPEEVDAKRASSDANALQLMEMAKEKGVQLLVENLPYPVQKGLVPLYTNEQYTEYFRQYPQQYSIIDIGHAHVNHLDLEKFLEEHGNRVLAYHFHNNDGKMDQHNHIFDGTFSFEEFAPLFRKFTPKASVVMEYEPHVTISWEELESQLNWIQDKFFA